MTSENYGKGKEERKQESKKVSFSRFHSFMGQKEREERDGILNVGQFFFVLCSFVRSVEWTLCLFSGSAVPPTAATATASLFGLK